MSFNVRVLLVVIATGTCIAMLAFALMAQALIHAGFASQRLTAPAAGLGVTCLTVCAFALASAPSALGADTTSASIAVSLSPDRPGARAALTVTIDYGGGELGVPSPVRRSVLRMPAGLSLDIPKLRSCSAARLRARGAAGCSSQSLLGRGQALAEVHAGSQRITEHATLWAFLGPLTGSLEPSFQILAQGYTPIDERKVLTGTVEGDDPPYGERLALPIPPIPSLPYEPDASIVTFSLTIGAFVDGRAPISRVLVPSVCPSGGFPFAGEFQYADGSKSSAYTSVPCP
ncbi:MAG TPA: hypothetical protein VMG62_03665 [Solirubrobacteraceae bacterium]|nr:hypothetical protein [Solirubrobacteraceae bacterium]